MLGDKVRVLPHAIACPFDLDDEGVMQEPVEQCRGDHGVAEEFAPLGETAVGGEDHGTSFVAGVDELEEQVHAVAIDGGVADPSTISSAERA